MWGSAMSSDFYCLLRVRGFLPPNPRGDWWLTSPSCLLRSRCESGCKWYCYRHAVPTGRKWHHTAPHGPLPFLLVSMLLLYVAPPSLPLSTSRTYKMCCPAAEGRAWVVLKRSPGGVEGVSQVTALLLPAFMSQEATRGWNTFRTFWFGPHNCDEK